jgi:hypothetical protein
VKGKQEMATFTEIAKALKSRGENSRNDFQTPTRRERDEENVEETNNEQGDEGSPLSSGDGDRGNALRFHEYMVMNGHMFYMCNGKLLWYKPDIGYYLEEDRACLFELRGLIGRCGCIEADYQQSTSKQGAMITQFKSIVPKEDDFYDLAGKNTFRKLAFYNGGATCIWIQTVGTSEIYTLAFGGVATNNNHEIQVDTITNTWSDYGTNNPNTVVDNGNTVSLSSGTTTFVVFNKPTSASWL